jgi:hypothetical protein
LLESPALDTVLGASGSQPSLILVNSYKSFPEKYTLNRSILAFCVIAFGIV